MVGAEAARLAGIAGELVRFAHRYEIGGVPTVEVLHQGQRDRRRDRPDQQVIAIARELFGNAPPGFGRAFIVPELNHDLAAVEAALGVGFVDRELNRAQHLLALLGEGA